MTTSTKIICELCEELAIPYQPIDADGVVLELTIKGQSHFVLNNTFGLISDSDAKLALDKTFQAQLLAKSGIIPRTQSYLDPASKYASPTTPSLIESAQRIAQSFSLPLILKKNSGSEGVNVFKIGQADEILPKLSEIFNQNSANYDHVAIAQEYILPKNEYRVVIFQGKIEIAYSKTIAVEAKALLSSHRWQDVTAELVTDERVTVKLTELVSTLFQVWPIRYAGLDIIEDQQGKFWLIEINSSPALAYFVRDNGTELVRKLYREILLALLKD